VYKDLQPVVEMPFSVVEVRIQSLKNGYYQMSKIRCITWKMCYLLLFFNHNEPSIDINNYGKITIRNIVVLKLKWIDSTQILNKMQKNT
jgi:hypothetical protein